MGGVSVKFGFAVQDEGATAKYTTSTEYVKSGEGFDAKSGLALYGRGGEGEKMQCVHPAKMADYPDAKRAHTDFFTLWFLGTRMSWMALEPITGRTHQLRFHMAEIGLRDRYSQFVVAGGPIGAVHPHFAAWHDTFWVPMFQFSPVQPALGPAARRVLAELRRLRILDTLPQKAFDSITALAAGICGTPMALISLVDSNRQWFKSRQGVELTQTSRSEAFCAHAIMEPSDVLVVNDATHDERFQDFPMVRRGELVFYAGAPIVTADGFALGTVCVIDHEVNGGKGQTLDLPLSKAITLIPKMKQTLEGRSVGILVAAGSGSGLGLHLVKQVSEDAHYERVGNYNVLRLTLRIPTEETAP